MDSASDSEKRNGEVHENCTPEWKRDRDLWLHTEGGGANDGWLGVTRTRCRRERKREKRVKAGERESEK